MKKPFLSSLKYVGLAGALLVAGGCAISVTKDEPPVETKVVLSSGEVNRGLIKDIVTFSGKQNPRVLVICAAAGDDDASYEWNEGFFREFSTRIERLKLLTPELTPEQMRAKILNSDIIWVCGGSTERLLERWAYYYLENSLAQAAARGTVMCGYSAGSICWSFAGFNDFSDGRYDLERGINLVPVFFGPHYQGEVWQRFDARLNSETDASLPDEGWALTDGASVFYTGDQPEVRFFTPTAQAVHFRRVDGRWQREVVARK